MRMGAVPEPLPDAPPYLKHALPARQESVQSLHAFLELCVQYFVHRQVIDKITNCGSVKVDALQKSKKQGEGGELS